MIYRFKGLWANYDIFETCEHIVIELVHNYIVRNMQELCSGVAIVQVDKGFRLLYIHV